ncbi:MAG: 4Fe-4S dicluster domain-containing protein [Armatimonadota bacterium]|nr:4Fe-4S dicluster domain-containing protein [Armatimonadota bacterium]MDR7451310.1 4Fe-4S dicluster domain-containing protein [Armatimonadota bacterium]MDR7466787.1 4Fe-4S dicluster domain-containing protein [Armatimonadota bacterium]MDR7492740.1 4Fe-4S dicluster domain-containing protein [Armatimonadota bacterium]MDR7498516.1 4Fe-4S dicluster domain-containing protein [Armatimonadota bacterium]
MRTEMTDGARSKASPAGAKLSRRKLLELGAAAGSSVLVGGRRPVRGVAAAAPALAPLPPGRDTEILRMQADIRRALQKPVEQRNWIMVIDGRKCVGCQACVVACAAENVLPPGVSYRSVPEIEYGTYPNVRRYPMPTQCMQCDKPPCMEAANAIAPGSITKRPDGIVAIDYTKFRGRAAFDAAFKACPYRALYYDDGRFYTQPTPAFQPYEEAVSHDYGRRWVRDRVRRGEPPIGGGRKCHFCLHRLNAGLVPACVSTCIGRAIYFGDKNDPQSLVNEVLAKNAGKVLRIRENRGTEPRVYYICDDVQLSTSVHT